MSKLAPPPPVSPNTWRSLLAAAADFTALEPWQFACDSDLVGLIDPVTGETRIGHVLGNAGEVFAAVFYRRAGVRWILTAFERPPEFEDFDGMDCLKMELTPKHELQKEDLSILKAAAFKSTFRPAGKAAFWPQFRSAEPGWHPWHINQTEAEQFLADLPRLTAFCKMFESHPDLFSNRHASDVPFLPEPLPARPLTPGDLDWRPLLPPPLKGLEPFQAPAGQIEQLRALKRQPALECEFDCRVSPGCSFLENGRPCFGRSCLLVENQNGLVLGMSVQSGRLTPGEAAGHGLIAALNMAKSLPGKILIGGSRLHPVLQPLCDELQIQLWPALALPELEEAFVSISQHMQGRGGF